MSWTLTLQHCPTNVCHAHPASVDFGSDGTRRTGSFVGQEHDYPSHLDLTLTVTDARGAKDTKTVRLDPKTIRLRLESDPPGRPLTLNDTSGTTAIEREVIVGARNSIGAAATDGAYRFVGWSDGGERARTYVAPGSDTTLVARYDETPLPPTTQPTPPIIPIIPIVPRSPDRTPPQLSLMIKAKQPALRTGEVRLSARCPREACTVSTDSSLSWRALRSAVRLRGTRTSLASGRTAELKLKLSSSVLKSARKAFDGKRSVVMRLALTAKDAAGNTTRDKRTIKLTR
jgi:hypothetical protein